MKIFGLTGNWFRAPIVIVTAETLEKAIELSYSEVKSPWNSVTVKILWSRTISSDNKSEVIDIYKPDTQTSHDLLNKIT